MRRSAIPRLSLFRLCRQAHEAGDVLAAICTRIAARSASMPKQPEILVEIAERRRKRDRLDPGRARPVDRASSSRRRRPDRCRGRCRGVAAVAGTGWRRDARRRAPRRPACRAGRTEATASSRCLRRPPATSPATPKRTAWPSRSPIARRGVSIGALPRRVAEAAGSSQVRCTPVSAAREIGDGGDHGRPCLRGLVLVGPIVAVGVEAQALPASCKAVMPRRAEIGFHGECRAIGCDMANRRRAAPAILRGASAMPTGVGRASRRMRQAEEAPRFVGDVLEVDADRRLSRMTSSRSPYSPVAASVHLPAGAFRRSRLEPTNMRAARRVADVADQPVGALAAAVGEIVAANRLGVLREALREFGGVASGHQAASRSPTRSSG